ncbi:class I SAM-dependent methyltransferase [Saccharothrix coeruleofusca]|uniref:Methyltransferase n=1 Tax=Saccharothrix coeruleofusca TaxID=33919 RepID=A0A918AXU2_9PSEU|nr:class I SAM-dependent methyltransferase [Saccharothrix coeruleofusca]MBP2337048.1 SAM-dependent methyltransferase [Saccharothrix coeruleofusca]GGP86705.1 methyltransferase [Saccharothrix coeruleofusca]
MTDFLDVTRRAYDAFAADYAEFFRTALADAPLDRALLTAFAEMVGDAGPVADVGSGPGRVTAHLSAAGADVFGVDLSAEMVALARREHPGLRFEVGSMTALDLPDAALGGLVSYYSLIHVPPRRQPEVIAEFHRVLAPGGHLLLAFQVGDEPLHLAEAFGHRVGLDFHRLRPDRVAAVLEETGFTVVARVLRELGEGEKSAKVPQACLIARKRA